MYNFHKYTATPVGATQVRWNYQCGSYFFQEFLVIEQ
jgi:hypothetical protein